MLAALGHKRVHLHDFVLFLAIVLGLAIAIVAVFVITQHGGPETDPPSPPAPGPE